MHIRGKRQKGNRSRRACIALLEQQGYQVDVVEKTSRFAKVRDLFGLFDLIAARKSDKNILFIQVSTNGNHPHKYLAEFKASFPFVGVRQYVWFDRKGFVMWHYFGLGAWRKEQIGKRKVEKAAGCLERYD